MEKNINYGEKASEIEEALRNLEKAINEKDDEGIKSNKKKILDLQKELNS